MKFFRFHFPWILESILLARTPIKNGRRCGWHKYAPTKRSPVYVCGRFTAEAVRSVIIALICDSDSDLKSGVSKVSNDTINAVIDGENARKRFIKGLDDLAHIDWAFETGDKTKIVDRFESYRGWIEVMFSSAFTKELNRQTTWARILPENMLNRDLHTFRLLPFIALPMSIYLDGGQDKRPYAKLSTKTLLKFYPGDLIDRRKRHKVKEAFCTVMEKMGLEVPDFKNWSEFYSFKWDYRRLFPPKPRKNRKFPVTQTETKGDVLELKRDVLETKGDAPPAETPYFKA